MSRSKQESLSGAALWIYRPWLDLVVGCGAWSVPLLLLAYFSPVESTRAWSLGLYGLALVFNYPHYMATIYRAYHTQADFNQYRIFTVHITLLVALTMVVSHLWFGALPWIFTLYLSASPWHYSGQNYGLFMMFARRGGAQPTAAVRRALYAAFVLSYLILLLNFHTGPSTDPLFVSLNLSQALTSKAQPILLLAFVACSCFGLYRVAAQIGLRKMAPSLTLFSTQCAWFLAPSLLSSLLRLEIPLSRYSSGVLAVMHSAQYLWITSYYARREAAATPGRSWRPLAYFTILIAGGIALFVPGPWLSSLVFHFDFTRSFLLFTALVNIHHFILDGAIWKLRDKRIAGLLVNSRADIVERSREAGSSAMAAFRWLAGPSPAAHRLRVGTACILLAWGVVDQTHYYFALRTNQLADLRRAAWLAPYDTSLQLRVARESLEKGIPQESEAAWEYAIRANPNDPAPRDAWLGYLLRERRLDEAYRRTGEWLQRAPQDAALLVNHGILAKQSGHDSEAQQNWQKALAVDPTQAEAEVYLGEELEKQGRVDDAISHYSAFLKKVTQRPASSLPPAANLVGVELKLADCQSRKGRTDAALQYYKMARLLATQTGEKKLESFANVAEAALRTKLGQTKETVPLYQRALQLDAGLNDPQSEAVDWYGYAVSLQGSGFPARFVYASVLKSESLGPSQSSSPEGDSVRKMQKELEQQLGPEAASIRHNPEPLLREALQLNASFR
jgi:tetratricopeptide (TPR) repeat protein